MKIVAYYRVSTDRQGRSGLGLDAQRLAVETYARERNAEVVGEFTEVETGKRADRPQLQAALAQARRSKATLVVAKLDRLARNVAFVAKLMEGGVSFDCADRPGADPFRLHIEAAIAEEEARKISRRTREALQAAKARGVKLGAADPSWSERNPDARRKGAAATAAAARQHHIDVVGIVAERKAAGASLRTIAVELTEAGFLTRRGLPYSAVAVQRLVGRS